MDRQEVREGPRKELNTAQTVPLGPKISLGDPVPLGKVSLLGLRPLPVIPLVHLGPFNPSSIHACGCRRPRNTFDAIFKTLIHSKSATTLGKTALDRKPLDQTERLTPQNFP